MTEIDDISDAELDIKNINHVELRLIIENWIKHQTHNYMDPNNARFHVRNSQQGILQVIKQ